MFGPKAGRFMGTLAADSLAVARGEAVGGRRPSARPHHQVCAVCGFDRWDGTGDHARGGVRFAVVCTGVAPRETTTPQPRGPSNPLVHELMGMTSTDPSLPLEAYEPGRPQPRLLLLGDARDPR